MFELPTVDYVVDDLETQKRPPAGLRLRPYAGESDIPTIVDIANRELEYDGVSGRESVPGVTAWYSHPNEKFDASRDVTIAEIDGMPVGFASRSWIDTTLDEFREYRNDGAVLPEWRRRGIGTALLAHNIERDRALARTHVTDRPRILGSFTSAQSTGANALLSSFGFKQARWFFEMTRDLNEPIPDTPLPDGLEVRPVTADTIRQIWDADVEAFLDHWGGFDGSEDNYKRFLERPNLDPTLWIIAWDGNEVAGGVVNAIEAEENESGVRCVAGPVMSAPHQVAATISVSAPTQRLQGREHELGQMLLHHTRRLSSALGYGMDAQDGRRLLRSGR